MQSVIDISPIEPSLSELCMLAPGVDVIMIFYEIMTKFFVSLESEYCYFLPKSNHNIDFQDTILFADKGSKSAKRLKKH
jgi:hypothetical protein